MQPEQTLNPPTTANPDQPALNLTPSSPQNTQIPGAPPSTVPRKPVPEVRFRLTAKEPKPPKKRFESWTSVLSTIALLLLAPLIAFLIAAFIVQSYEVDGQSMETTLQNNDRLIVDKWPRTWARITGQPYVPRRGDIIIFNQSGIDYVGGPPKQLIKRVIGLPGEHVTVTGGKITIYNQQHPEGFNPDSSGLYLITAHDTLGSVNLTLKSDQIFVCGDNRPNSEDSRYFGPINASQIVGKLAFRIIPLNKAQRF